jgi:hypothetical protein
VAAAYGGSLQARQQKYFPRQSWTVIPEDRNALKSSIGDADMGEFRFTFSNLASIVIGIELSEKTIALAGEAYKQRQSSGIPLFGRASFHAGDMCSVFKSRVGQKVGAFFFNRVLHLLARLIFAKDAVH